VEGGKYENAEILLKHGANVNTSNNRDETPLYLATVNRNAKMMELLLAHDADPNLKGDESPLDVAKRYKSRVLQKLLVKYGALETVNVD
jgi:ankyrin repeat protein